MSTFTNSGIGERSTFTDWNGPRAFDELGVKLRRELDGMREQMQRIEESLNARLDRVNVVGDSLAGNGTVPNPLRLAQVFADQDTIRGNGTTHNPADMLRLSKVYTDHTLTGSGTASDALKVVPAEATQVSSDSTLKGQGTPSNPLGLAGSDTYLDNGNPRRPLLQRGMVRGRHALTVGNPMLTTYIDSRYRPRVIDNSITNPERREKRIAYTSDIVRKLSWKGRVTVIFKDLVSVDAIAPGANPARSVNVFYGEDIVEYFFQEGDIALVMETARLYQYSLVNVPGPWFDLNVQLEPTPGQSAFVWYGLAKQDIEETYSRNFVLWTPRETEKWHVVDSIRGPRGVEGPQGAGLSFIGVFDDESELPVSGNTGEAAVVNQNIWIWVRDVLHPNGGTWEDGGLFHGSTPHIGLNNNWWIDSTDTGVPATGQRGSMMRGAYDDLSEVPLTFDPPVIMGDYIYVGGEIFVWGE